MDMGNTINGIPSRRYFPLRKLALRLITAMGTISACSIACADPWTITPTVQLTETYTDNVNLAPSAQAESDFVTEISPSVSVSESSHYFNAQGQFSLQQIDYADHNAPSSFFTQLQSNARAELIDNLFFLNGMASVSQQNISALGAQSNSNIYDTGNRTNVRTYSVGPSIVHTFDSFAAVEIDYTFASASANTGGLSNTQSDTTAFKFTSGPSYDIWVWGLQYNDQTIHYPSQSAVDVASSTASLTYMVVPGLHLIVTAGYDDNNYSALSGTTKGNSWSGGFSWNVSELTTLTASAGRRYYGDNYTLNAVTRGHQTLFNLGYSESVTTTQSQFGLPATNSTATILNQLLTASIPDATQRGEAVSSIIQSGLLPSSLATATNYFTNSVFLLKQLQATFAFTGHYNTALINAFSSEQDPLSTQQAISLLLGNVKTKQVGGSAIFSRTLSSTATANFSLVASRTDSESLGDVVVRNQSESIGLTKKFSKRLQCLFEIRHDQQEAGQTGVSYHENAIDANLTYQL